MPANVHSYAKDSWRLHLRRTVMCNSAAVQLRLHRAPVSVMPAAATRQIACALPCQQAPCCAPVFFLSKLVTWAGPSNNKFTSEKDPERGWGNLF
jgi:hypothetical protein